MGKNRSLAMFGISGAFLLFAIPGLLLGIYAQIKLTAAYNKYLRINSERGLRGAEAAREILDHAGLQAVPVEEVEGHLTDHYDPMRKALFLSSENYHGTSLSAVGVAAHETGHALQHQAAYLPLQLRMAIVPVTNIASNAAQILFFVGIFLNMFQFAIAGVVIYTVLTVFHLVTLPVEFDASRRAKDQLIRLGLISSQERTGVSKVLNAAAMTYVAALVTSLFQLLYFVMLARGEERD
jgi:Zn-dependent membrane protease YugP